MHVTHYDLFAGIGGFSYALDTIFTQQPITHIFCEWEAFPTAVLKTHWPNASYYGDIADLVAHTDEQRRTRIEDKGTEGQHRLRGGAWPDQDDRLVIVTGGFPCQPFSHAGRRKGTSDHRYKWPEMFTVIRNVQPDWIIAENVRGLVTWNNGMVLETVCADLESEGYEVQPLIVPACAVGAPHRRDRVWIIAHRHYTGSGAQRGHLPSPKWAQDGQKRKHAQHRTGGHRVPTANPGCERRLPGSNEGIRSACPAPRLPDDQYAGSAWDRDWREVAFATCHDRVDDGLSRSVDGTAISAARHRRERLKACGNAIAPQIAMEIFRAIKQL